MLIFKIICGAIISLYGAYLVIGLLLLLPEILWAVSVLLNAPIKGPIKKDELGFYRVPLSKLINEIPELLRDWLQATIFWIILPFLVIKAFFEKNVSEEAGQ